MTYFADYRLDATRTYVLHPETGDELDFCERIEITDVYVNIINKTRKVAVKITTAPGVAASLTIDREVLVQDVLTPLCAIGLTVSPVSQYAVTVAEILFLTEATATVHYVHDRLGFTDVDGKLCFLSAESIGLPIVSRHGEFGRYKSKGILQDWSRGVAPYVNSRPELQLALAIGFMAPVAGLLMRMGLVTETPMYAFIGQSSTGKSTALKLCCSAWYKPSSFNGGIDLLVDTENYMYASLTEKTGVPTFLDDTSTMPYADFTKMIYTMAGSKERGRCNSDGTKKHVRGWSGAVIFTGEQSMLASTNGLGGLSARLVEFNLLWTKDAASAESLAVVINKCYGTAHVSFVKALIRGGKKLLKERFKASVDMLAANFKASTGVQRRQVQKFALIVTALFYMLEAFDFTLDVPAIEKLLKETYEANLELESPAVKIHDMLLQKILARRHLFPPKTGKLKLLDDALGEESNYNNVPCFWLTSKTFTDYLEDEGYVDIKAVCKLLHSEGCIAKFGDRYKKRYQISGVNNQCYAVYKDPWAPKADKSKKKSKPKSSIQNASKRATLLDDEEELEE